MKNIKILPLSKLESVVEIMENRLSSIGNIVHVTPMSKCPKESLSGHLPLAI